MASRAGWACFEKRMYRALCGLLAVLVLTGSGCVHRRMTIRSNPPGALVYVDNIYEIGTTPISFDFIYYGTRKIKLVKSGFETVEDEVTIKAPAYQLFPIDFFVENLYPAEIKDHRHLTYQLQPQLITPTDQLLQRADSLRGVRPASLEEPTLPYQLPGTYQPPLLVPNGADLPPSLPPSR